MIDINYKIDLEIIKRYSKGILDRINNTFLDSEFYKNIFKFSVLRFEIGVATVKVSRLLRRIEKLKKIDPELRNKKELYKLINKYLGVSEVEKKQSGEVFTPFWLIEKMLDTLSTHVWTNPNLKWFDPASGIGNFQVVILTRLMVGLKDVIKDENERYKHIMQNMIYTCDISDKNTFLYKNIFDPKNELKLNHFYGDFLSPEFNEHIKNVWNFKFDIIVGNPPYNMGTTGGYGGRDLWDKFTQKSIQLLKNDGYLVFVHPSKWRKPEHKLYKVFKKYNLIYLKINSKKEGKKTFGATTRYDYYCLQKCSYNGVTLIVDEIGKINKINIKDWDWIPNYNFDKIKKILSVDINENIIYSRSFYGGDKKWMSKEKNSKYNLPCIYGMYNDGTFSLQYSEIDKGHFGQSKVIINCGEVLYPFIDMNGDYGIMQNAFGIKISSLNEGLNIKKAIESDDFKEIVKSTKWLNFQADWKMFKSFRKDFWKDFI